MTYEVCQANYEEWNENPNYPVEDLPDFINPNRRKREIFEEEGHYSKGLLSTRKGLHSSKSKRTKRDIGPQTSCLVSLRE